MTIVIIAFLCYLLASAFFLLCVMLTARGKEYGSRVTAPSKHSGAVRSYATVAPSLRQKRNHLICPIVRSRWWWQIALDFNVALGGGMEKGDIVLLVSLDAIEPVSISL
jgi:hypothetical protein